ncbi:glutathione S-transferase [Falsiroseomonas bella]|uniref:Glutathione S-transferase n=1 Tax=Falsiroseomonas bella TaxID=2184016 RepID=A0A317F4H2_9PROT|nr:glutathione S-transferase family protein [Falsiroseomonas bella]PWS34060.1 glutathione S-transferase [Falsiroseomonas bella]
MLTIYGVLRSRASRNVWLAHELGMPFEHVPVIQAGRAEGSGVALNTRSPEFLRINPNGRIPAMKDGDLVLAESLAINLYMAKKAGGALAPKDLAEDAQMTAWTIWAMTEAEPHTIEVLYNSIGKPPAERDAAKLAAAVAALKAPFAVLDAALAKDGFLVGGRFTVADLNLAEVMRYAQPAPQLFEAAPNVKTWLAACQARPAFQRMMEERNKEPA